MILLILFAVCLLAAFGCYWVVFRSPKKGQNDIYNLPAGEQYEQFHDRMVAGITAAAAIPSEKVTIPARDGLTLAAHYCRTADGAPLAICFHGYRATALRDFSGGVRFLMSMGMNVLLIDQRSQGESTGHTVTFGVKERFDCLDWIAWARERFGQEVPITLYGISMGAATVLLAAGLGLPENVRGVVADSPYDSPKSIIRKVCRDLRLPDGLIYPFIALGARLFGGFRPGDGDVIGAVKKAQVPILMIHGEDDRFVPCDMSRAIRAANPERVSLHTFPQAGHGISYLYDKPRYIALIRQFLADLDVL